MSIRLQPFQQPKGFKPLLPTYTFTHLISFQGIYIHKFTSSISTSKIPQQITIHIHNFTINIINNTLSQLYIQDLFFSNKDTSKSSYLQQPRSLLQSFNSSFSFLPSSFSTFLLLPFLSSFSAKALFSLLPLFFFSLGVKWQELSTCKLFYSTNGFIQGLGFFQSKGP